MLRHLEAWLCFMALTSFWLAAMTSARVPLMLLGVSGVGAVLVVVPLHFVKAWRRFPSIPNKREYALWVGFEMVFACGFLVCVIWALRS